MSELTAMLEGLKITSVMRDERFSGQLIDVTFRGTFARSNRRL